MIDSAEGLRQWFRACGVEGPLRACVGPLPQSGVALGRWSSEEPDHTVRAVCPHPHSYRLALMLEPLEACVWNGGQAVWGGTIGAQRFRLCAPEERGHWSRLSGCDIVNVFLPVALVERLAQARDDPPGTALAECSFLHDRTVNTLVQQMLDGQALAGPLAALACDHLATILASYLLEHYANAPQRAAPGGLCGARLRRVLQHLDAHCCEPLSNGEIAAFCGMSAAHFSREFHRSVGFTPHRYLMKRRLEHARAALACATARIVDIAQESGFASASHFARAFSAQYGLSPAAWRRQQFRDG
jgi:AraC family transcriptional regulator